MSLRGLRACMVCSIVQPGTKFVQAGCPNCEEFLEMRHSADVVQDCTSAVFEGMIALTNPKDSWVAKWQRLTEYVPGSYAVKVEGTVSCPAVTISCSSLIPRSFRKTTPLLQSTLESSTRPETALRPRSLRRAPSVKHAIEHGVIWAFKGRSSIGIGRFQGR